MARRKHKNLKADERDIIMTKAAEGLSCAEIRKLLPRKINSGSVSYWMKKGKSTALVTRAHQALEKSNSHPLQMALSAFVDVLNKAGTEIGEIEEVRVRPKDRRCKLVLRREVELTV